MIWTAESRSRPPLSNRVSFREHVTFDGANLLALPIIMGMGNQARYGNMKTRWRSPAIANMATKASAAVSDGL